ncbi:MAG: rRNA pseudouridine synthase [Phycisphaerales bacterium]|nr:rRNA pseudouridine synthase [Phycisphaerales bacterium]
MTTARNQPIDGEQPTQRLAKVMARQGLCSKRMADRLIALGYVTVDGVAPPTTGMFIPPDAEIRILPAGQRMLDGQLTIMLHKPRGVVSNLPKPGQRQASDLITREAHVGPIAPELTRTWDRIGGRIASFHVAGRLDFDSSGLLILTEDGTVARLLTSDQHILDKEYTVAVTVPGSQPVPSGSLMRLSRPIHDAGETLRAELVEQIGPRTLRFVLREGRKHQIRRMCRAVGLNVTGLQRIRVGRLALGDLPVGRWRIVTPDEIM